jgi:phage shock protein PspC (stress-responsive transcriptional regulator)
MESTERLYRIKSQGVLGGVCAGLAEYFAIDVILARVVFVLLALFGGGGVLIYIVLWVVIPRQPDFVYNQSSEPGNGNKAGDDDVEVIYENKPARQTNTGLIAGVILILLGLLFLGDRLLPWYNIADLWPLILVAVGVLLIKPEIFKPSKKQNNEI